MSSSRTAAGFLVRLSKYKKGVSRFVNSSTRLLIMLQHLLVIDLKMTVLPAWSRRALSQLVLQRHWCWCATLTVPWGGDSSSHAPCHLAPLVWSVETAPAIELTGLWAVDRSKTFCDQSFHRCSYCPLRIKTMDTQWIMCQMTNNIP